MRGFRIAIVILFFLLGGLGVRGGAAAPDLKALAWMAGNWTGTQDGVEMEELWLKPKGNTMLGLHRDVREGRTVMFEFLRIEETAEAITYWASPRGRPATPFRMVELLKRRVVFENAEHDFPRRIIYWLGPDGSLHARTERHYQGPACLGRVDLASD